MIPHSVLHGSVICNCSITSSLVLDSVIPQGGLDRSVICYCSITSSLVFEIM